MRIKFRALIFDVDGTLSDSEREGHLPACNAAFERMGLPVRWSWEDFLGLLPIPGNAERLTQWLRARTSFSESHITRVVAEFRQLKQEIYIRECLPQLQLRPGVRRIIAEAAGRGLRLAIVSTSNEPQIIALLDAQLPEFRELFSPVLGKESGRKTGAEGRLYTRCMEEMGLAPDEALAIEDSEAGLDAARRAGVPCAVIYNSTTFGAPFAGARMVAGSFASLSLDQLLSLSALAEIRRAADDDVGSAHPQAVAAQTATMPAPNN